MKNIPFIEPVFKGNRFASGQPHLPVEVLPEVIAYDNIIKAIAKELYFSSHTNRSRLPKGFQERFKLSMTVIKSGSVIPVLTREYERDQQKEDDEFDHARDLLNEFIQSVNDQTPLEKFPKKVIPLFANSKG